MVELGRKDSSIFIKRRQNYWPTSLAVAIIAFLPSLWLFSGGFSDTACALAFPDMPEGSFLRQKVSIWGPRTLCDITLPDGTEKILVRTPTIYAIAFALVISILAGAVTALFIKTVRLLK